MKIYLNRKFTENLNTFGNGILMGIVESPTILWAIVRWPFRLVKNICLTIFEYGGAEVGLTVLLIGTIVGIITILIGVLTMATNGADATPSEIREARAVSACTDQAIKDAGVKNGDVPLIHLQVKNIVKVCATKEALK
jgi:hypothetical protein